jgi:hypothetical protein
VNAGLVIDLRARREVAALTLHTPTPGFDVEVYAVERGTPETLEGWERVATARDVGREERIELEQLDGGVRRLLVWITDAGDDEDPRVAVGEVAVVAG